MDKQEFLQTLQEALEGEVNQSKIADNMAYYNQYIDSELASGKTESEIMAVLGDPRLLAKTIISASHAAAEQETIFESYSSRPDTDLNREDMPETRGGVSGINQWKFYGIIAAIIAIVVLIVIGFIKLLPFILVGALIIWVIKRFTR